jgi:glycosyltransferase involved in cell wall biosynthesis
MSEPISSDSPLVVVVLSTFNGERYLDEQFASLFSQTHENIDIIVRDDGSSDGTTRLLERVAAENKNVTLHLGENVGVVASFLDLLDMVPDTADYVALCDQDDVWRDDKIERALGLLSDLNHRGPTMYCGAVEVVDEQLRHIRVERQATKQVTLGNALVQNVATGCTTVINKKALQLITAKRAAANQIGMHDWWLYQVVSAHGQVVFDDDPKILYRQHGGNVVGYASGFRFWLNRVKRQVGPQSKTISRQAAELLRLYGDDISAENHEMVREFLDRTQASSVWERLKYALRTPAFRQRPFDSLVMRTMMVFARI